MKKYYDQPRVEWIKLVSSSVITESVPIGGDDETEILPFGVGSYDNSKVSDSYTY